MSISVINFIATYNLHPENDQFPGNSTHETSHWSRVHSASLMGGRTSRGIDVSFPDGADNKKPAKAGCDQVGEQLSSVLCRTPAQAIHTRYRALEVR